MLRTAHATKDPFRVYVNGDTSVSVAMPMPETLRNTSTPKPAKPTQVLTATQLMPRTNRDPPTQ